MTRAASRRPYLALFSHVTFGRWLEGDELGHTNREIELERQKCFAAVPLCVLEHRADPAIGGLLSAVVVVFYRDGQSVMCHLGFALFR